MAFGTRTGAGNPPVDPFAELIPPLHTGRTSGLRNPSIRAQQDLAEQQRRTLSNFEALGATDLQPNQRQIFEGIRQRLEAQLLAIRPGEKSRGASLLSRSPSTQERAADTTVLGRQATDAITGARTLQGTVRAKGGLITRRRGHI